MNHIIKTTTIRLAIIVIASVTMIVGTIFSPIVLQEAYSSSTVRHQVKGEEQQGVHSSLEQQQRNHHQQQHMNQGNLCLRAGKCSNSNVGEQTLGNDNSITGFSDQSSNTQVILTPTPTVTPTPTPTLGGVTPCSESTAFIALITEPITLANGQSLPTFTGLCLLSAGVNMRITAITPNGPTVTVNIVVSQIGPTGICCCPPDIVATISRIFGGDGLPDGLTGNAVCVHAV